MIRNTGKDEPLVKAFAVVLLKKSLPDH